mgnify:CR=1 FL=1
MEVKIFYNVSFFEDYSEAQVGEYLRKFVLTTNYPAQIYTISKMEYEHCWIYPN